jgi:small GTP-binding protein
MWDIAGQERFDNMTRVYYKGAEAALIVFDVSNHKSFESVTKWKEDIDQKASLPDGSRIPCILLANKCDLENTVYQSHEELDKFIQENGIFKWIETSSKTGTGIESAMNGLLDKLWQNAVEISTSGTDVKDSGIVTLDDKRLNTSTQIVSGKGGCC